MKSGNSKRFTHQGADQFYSDFELGNIIWDKFDDCSGKRMKTFGQLSFPLEIKEYSLKTVLEKCY